MGNQGIHQMDVARWFLGETALSPRVVSFGGRLGYEDAGNTANTQVVLHDYGGPADLRNARPAEVEGRQARMGRFDGQVPRLGRRRRRAVRERLRAHPEVHGEATAYGN